MPGVIFAQLRFLEVFFFMKSMYLIFFKSFPTLRIFTVSALLLFAASVMSGGCGGSSTSSLSFTSTNDTMNGAWIYNSGTVTANVNGMRSELTVLNFAVLFESCDIEEESGSAVFTAAAPLQGQHFMLPLLFDKTIITTTRNAYGSWTADTEHGNFTITLLSEDKASLTGSVSWLGSGSVTADVDIIISKLPSTAPTLDINSTLDGEWQTRLLSGDNGTLRTEGGGGYHFHNGNLVPVASAFANLKFSNTNIQDGTTDFMGVAVQGSVTSSDGTPQYDAKYYVINNRPFTIEHMFGDVYMLQDSDSVSASSTDGNVFMPADSEAVPTSMVIVLGSADRLYLINRIYFDYDGGVDEDRGLFTLNKAAASNTIDIRKYIGSSWRSALSFLDVYADDEDYTLLNADLASFDVSFPSADIANRTLTLSAHGTVTTQTAAFPLEYPAVTLSVQNAGYNMWFGESEAGNLFTVTMITDRLAIVTADIEYTRDNLYFVELFAVMQRLDEE